ncbi:MAG TPA: SRPBCC family protein [Jatrophihabitans sp.]|jgi:hypothetical protein
MDLIETSWHTTALPDDVWAVLADGWLYSSWVVGASRIRDADRDWPAVGSRIHHSVGAWPFLLDDETRVLVCQRGQLLTLLARTRPLGEAEVEITLAEQPGGGTEIRMREDFVSGIGKAAPAALRQRALVPRNRESLRRLGYLAEGRAR